MRNDTPPDFQAKRNPVRQALLRLYREIGISAVTAALDATARKPQTPPQSRKDISAVLRGDEVLFGRYSGNDIEVDGKELKIMRESDILAKVAK